MTPAPGLECTWKAGFLAKVDFFLGETGVIDGSCCYGVRHHTPDEDAEYEALIDGADLITILKLKAQRLLTA